MSSSYPRFAESSFLSKSKFDGAGVPRSQKDAMFAPTSPSGNFSYFISRSNNPLLHIEWVSEGNSTTYYIGITNLHTADQIRFQHTHFDGISALF